MQCDSLGDRNPAHCCGKPVLEIITKMSAGNGEQIEPNKLKLQLLRTELTSHSNLEDRGGFKYEKFNKNQLLWSQSNWNVASMDLIKL